ncbi:winged helix-turn-helix transcriptional regulator [Streptomyces sp. YKOK-I1]
MQARDEAVYRLIASGTCSRSELAAATGLDRPTIALSVQRLKKQGRIRTCAVGGAIVWSVADNTPCP